MKGFSIVLAGNGDDLCVLVRKGFIPQGRRSKIELETGIGLKKEQLFFSNISGLTSYYIEGPLSPINGWKWIPLISLKKLEKNFGAFLCEALGKFWNVMPDFEKKLGDIKLPKLFKKKKFSDEVIFYPGSFNPWHKGHMACLNLCPSKSKIIVVPDNNPWKNTGRESCKWEKYRNLCLTLKNSSCSIYPGFLGLQKKNPTINWFPKTRVKKKALLMGDDSFLSLINWKESRKLISSMQKIYVVPRLGIKDDLKLATNGLLSINSKLKIKFLSPHKFQRISSTEIRGD
jgi:nicotinic acid mononucleotide adenylyltransferase